VLTSPLTVNYNVGGTATINNDYTPIGADSFFATTGTVTFAVGSDTAIVTVDPTTDTTVEADETVSLTLASGTGYTIATTSAVTGTIANDDVVNPSTGVLLGTPQNDSLDATTGQYTVIPYSGDDTIVVNTASDVILELPNEGTDTIVSSVNYNLAAQTHIENLTLTGTDDITGIGNRKNNVITGNSGQNVLVGLQGDDTFVFNFGDSTIAKPDRIRDFGVGADRIQVGDRLLSINDLPSATYDVRTLEELVNSVFTDSSSASGLQTLESAALGTYTSFGVTNVTNTYLIANDGIPGFNTETDLIINIARIANDRLVSYL
jgi:Ca2+-binding RTX toxin-like protein